jgi:hypothetical protein
MDPNHIIGSGYASADYFQPKNILLTVLFITAIMDFSAPVAPSSSHCHQDLLPRLLIPRSQLVSGVASYTQF